MNALIQILTLHCDGASELASRELDEPLHLVERLALYGHLISCRACREFRYQIRKLHELSSAMDRTPSESAPGEETLSPEAHARISHAIIQASANHPNGDPSVP
jgi:predicted anti-sigma-YlaC factor YlaD